MSTVAVVGGGANPEHEVSLASATAVERALRQSGHEVVSLRIGPDGTWHDPAGPLVGSAGLAAAVERLQSCAVVVPVVHGRHGEDGTLAALCELAGVAYVGSGLVAGAVGMDKWATKLVAEGVGVRTAAGLLLRRGASVPPLDLPVVVKPVGAGSSYGVSLVRTEAELDEAVARAFSFDDRILVEEVVHGREVDIAVLSRADGSRLVAPALEILPTATGIFDLAAKYDGSARFVVPAPVEEAELKGLQDAAVRVFDALGCSGVARVDFFLTAAGPVLNEINTMPGLTEHSQVPRMFAAAGISYAELVEMLVSDALART